MGIGFSIGYDGFTKKRYEAGELFRHGTETDVNRKIQVLDRSTIEQWLNISYGSDVKAVGYFTENSVTNTGKFQWSDSTGMPCIWMLDMFPPSPNTTVIIPYKKDSTNKPANTGYFGEIPTGPDKVRRQHIIFQSRWQDAR